MGIRLIVGRAGSGKSQRCYEELAQCMEKKKSAILLVPDQATYEAERRLAESMPHGGFSHIQVLGFSRLAYRIFSERERMPVSLSDLAKRIILEQLLLREEHKLQVLGKAAKQRSFSVVMKDFISECQSFCVTPAQLRSAARVSSLGLQKKLEDIALLYEGYEHYIAEKLPGAEDRFTLLAKESKRSSYLKDTPIWIDGFHWFTPQQRQVIWALSQVVPAITMTLTLPPEEWEKQSTDTALFHRPWQVYKEIKEDIGIEEVVELKEMPRYQRESGLSLVEQILSKGRAAIEVQGCAKGLHLYEAETREAELEGIARELLRRCREENWRWKDMALVLRNREEYGDLPERILEQYHIPYFTDRRRSMLEHPLAELVLAGLHTVQHNWAYDDVFRLLKTDLLGFTRQEVDELENYCLAYGIRSWHWLQEEDWAYYERYSIEDTEGPDKESKEQLLRINQLRRKVVKILQPLWQHKDAVLSARQWCKELLSWLDALEVNKTLQRWQEEDLSPIKEQEQIWRAILSLLEEIYEVCAEEEWDLRTFAAILYDGMEGLEFAFIPPTIDHVMITSIDRSYGMERKGIFVIGANDGIFPGRSQEEGLLHDEERQQLARVGLFLAPDCQFKTLQEKFLFYLACTRSKEALYLSYSASDGAGLRLEPSLPVRQLLEAQLGTVQYWTALPVKGQEKEWFVQKERVLSLLPLLLGRAREGSKIENLWWALYDWAREREDGVYQKLEGLFWTMENKALPKDMVRSLYVSNNRLKGSVTRFEAFQSCPFRFYAQYGLKLEERKVFQLRPPDTGQLVHSVLRSIGEEIIRKRKQWKDMDKDVLLKRCQEIMDELAPKVQQGILYRDSSFLQRKHRLEETVLRTIERLYEFSKVSDFQTIGLEKSFGFGRIGWDPLPIPLADGLLLEIIGQIDRIDILKTAEEMYALVLDYKSGKNTIQAQDVYYGIKLQLLVYMYIVLREWEAEPAGALYCYVNNKQTSSSVPVSEQTMKEVYRKELKMKGYVMKEEEVVRHLDTSIDGYSSYVNVYLKNGKFRADADGMKDRGEWDLLLRHTIGKLKEIGNRIYNGAIEVAPVWYDGTSACTWCPYRSVCRFDPTSSACRWKVLPKLKEEEALEKMRQEGGH